MLNQKTDKNCFHGVVVLLLFLVFCFGMSAGNSVVPGHYSCKFESVFNSYFPKDTLSNIHLVQDLKSLKAAVNDLNPKVSGLVNDIISANCIINHQITQIHSKSILSKPDLIFRFYQNYYTNTEESPVLS